MPTGETGPLAGPERLPPEETAPGMEESSNLLTGVTHYCGGERRCEKYPLIYESYSHHK